MSTEADYHRSGERLDRHLAQCALCADGVTCPAGDSAAEKEFRAFRDWEREEADAARAFRNSDAWQRWRAS